jgi:hypothetical protein
MKPEPLFEVNEHHGTMVVVSVRFFHFMGCIPCAVVITGNMVIFPHSLTFLIDKSI